MPYDAQQRQTILLKAKLAANGGIVTKDDYQDFMDQCVADLEDSGIDDPEALCQLIWEQQEE